MTDAKPVAPYGICPFCGSPGVTRERRPNGNDVCKLGHTYPSRSSVGEPKREPDAKPDVGALVARLNKSCRYAGTNNEHGSPISACPGACKEHAVMTEAARALLALQAEVARLRKWKKQILLAAGAQENDDVAKWICNSDAEVARLTQERDLWSGAAYRVGELLGPIGPDGYYCYTPTRWAEWAVSAANTNNAERDRLTQENARLAGEVDNWRKKYGNDKPWDSPSSRTPIPTAIITKARRDEQ